MSTTKTTTKENIARSQTASTQSQASSSRSQAGSHRFAGGIVLIAGWLVPGLGHLLQGLWIRATLLFVSIVSMFCLGLAMHGKIYPPASDLLSLDMLGFIGDLGTGGLYFLSTLLGWGQNIVQIITADYGTKFIVVAGLLNFIAAVDAHSIKLGRKR